ncbi:LemA family protein [Anaerosporobacter faecicola]|uniref:LemA family protein n=1 Tax=Anaerosporobacter faecicola TaxID=2718714 RepID=UPI001439FF73|nr:LemA family protein [Anaerosporobacter faecicola]
MTIGIIIAVIVLFILWFILSYNGFVKQKAFVEEAFSGMDVYLQKRYDLIPNLVACVKSYMIHEQDTLEKVINLRNQSITQQNPSSKIQVENELSNQLSKLFALAESYPDLKANQQFFSLQTDLTRIETDIAQARKYYNGAVKKFNIRVNTIPSNIVASLCHFSKFPYFETQEAERNSVKVEF